MADVAHGGYSLYIYIYIYINVRRSPCAARRQFLLGKINIAAQHLRDTFSSEQQFHHFRRKLLTKQGTIMKILIDNF